MKEQTHMLAIIAGRCVYRGGGVVSCSCIHISENPSTLYSSVCHGGWLRQVTSWPVIEPRRSLLGRRLPCFSLNGSTPVRACLWLLPERCQNLLINTSAMNTEAMAEVLVAHVEFVSIIL
ncbi:Hypothetical_protein [Hexamita inflata]|uniref:Hypothetical_protein n=1 Tax=Hexamita inflata TaxID=28002 RepID=A0AA86U0I8_9EUKA|nr:Hypothetical protein HINF_LOCUS24765 [Hexamita inflata]